MLSRVRCAGQVVHRSRNLTSAIDWALDRTQEFYDRYKRAGHAELTAAREVLDQHGRLLHVAQA